MFRLLRHKNNNDEQKKSDTDEITRMTPSNIKRPHENHATDEIKWDVLYCRHVPKVARIVVIHQLTEEQKREAARSVLRERRFESAYEDWARELRAAAWVEMRDAP